MDVKLQLYWSGKGQCELYSLIFLGFLKIFLLLLIFSFFLSIKLRKVFRFLSQPIEVTYGQMPAEPFVC